MRTNAALIAEYAKKNPGMVTVGTVNPESFKIVEVTCSGIFGRAVVPIPPRLSDLFVGRNHHISPKYREWRKTADPFFQKLRPVPPELYPVEVYYVIQPGRNWRADADVANREKAITDAMVRVGVLVDDKQCYVAGVRGARAEPIRVKRGERKPETTAVVWWQPFRKWWDF